MQPLVVIGYRPTTYGWTVAFPYHKSTGNELLHHWLTNAFVFMYRWFPSHSTWVNPQSHSIQINHDSTVPSVKHQLTSIIHDQIFQLSIRKSVFLSLPLVDFPLPNEGLPLWDTPPKSAACAAREYSLVRPIPRRYWSNMVVVTCGWWMVNDE